MMVTERINPVSPHTAFAGSEIEHSDDQMKQRRDDQFEFNSSLSTSPGNLSAAISRTRRVQ